MKKLGALLVIVIMVFACVACGPYGDYAGTYSRSSSNSTFTVTLGQDGLFKFERKYSDSSSLKGGPLDTADRNIRKGRYYTQEGSDTITIEFTYKDEVRGTVSGTATATIKENKLTIIDSSGQISGTYTKK